MSLDVGCGVTADGSDFQSPLSRQIQYSLHQSPGRAAPSQSRIRFNMRQNQHVTPEAVVGESELPIFYQLKTAEGGVVSNFAHPDTVSRKRAAVKVL